MEVIVPVKIYTFILNSYILFNFKVMQVHHNKSRTVFDYLGAKLSLWLFQTMIQICTVIDRELGGGIYVK